MSLTISTPTDHQILVKRLLNASVPFLWRSYTKPDLAKRWVVGPSRHTMSVCEIDFRVNGQARYVWHLAQANVTMLAHFRDIIVHKSIVHTEVVNSDLHRGPLITTRFIDQNQQTLVSTLIQYNSKLIRDTVLHSDSVINMEHSFNKLDTLINGLNG